LDKTDGKMRILGINHLGLAPKDPVKAKWFFREILKLPFEGEELVVSQNTLTTMFDSSHGPTHTPGRLEILENDEGKDGPIKKYLEKKGGGIHHVALTVASVEEAIAAMLRQNIEMIDKAPRPGAHNTRIAFVHPGATGGILVEFVEEAPQ
jgi:methylmalonyl-CoA/ethylmalonyl-CoA epimerase